MTDLNSFLLFVSDSAGKISSRRFRKDFFIRNGREELWQWFIQTSEHLNCYDNNQKIFLLQRNVLTPPKCIVCGEPSIVGYGPKGTISDHCSKKCSHASSDRAQRISATKKQKNQDVTYKQQIEDKRKQTMVQKYGVEFNSQREEVKELLHFKQNIIDIPISVLINEYNSGMSLVDLGLKYNVDYSTIRKRLVDNGVEIRQKTNTSQFENIIENMLISNGISYSRNNFSLLKKTKSLELDFLIEDYKAAIEVNGLYWHSWEIKETKDQREKHLFKTESCQEQGYKLFHFTDEQIKTKLPIITSMIKNRCSQSKKVYGRKTNIIQLESSDCIKFFNENHIQGFTSGSLYYGLENDGQIVCAISLGRPRFNSNKYEWELIRFANLLDHNVVGGFSKLLSFFRKTNSGNIISFADRQWSNGNLYITNGFKLSHITPPGYGWTDGGHLYSRIRFQKNKLEDLHNRGILNIFDPNKSESENMFDNGYRRYWDCGQYVFEI